jgi:tetratricopeptide (TPR) repeat protein
VVKTNFWISYIIVATISLTWCPMLFAKTSNKATLSSGIEHYKSGDYSLALVDWYTLLQNKKYASSPEVLYNLALTEFKLEDYGASIGHLRKSLALNPLSIKTHKTLKLVSKTIETKEFYRIDEEPFLYIVFNWLPKTIFIAIFFITLIISTIIGLRQKRQGTLFWPFFKTYFFFLIGSTIPLLALVWQSQLHNQTFATLTGNKPIPLFTSQDSKAPELGKLRVGDSFKVISFLNIQKSENQSSNNLEDKVKDPKLNDHWVAVATEEIPLGWINTKDYIVYRGKIDQ